MGVAYDVPERDLTYLCGVVVSSQSSIGHADSIDSPTVAKLRLSGSAVGLKPDGVPKVSVEWTHITCELLAGYARPSLPPLLEAAAKMRIFFPCALSMASSSSS